MIEISTVLRMSQDDAVKTVVMEMDNDAAFALATILFNLGFNQGVSPEWMDAFRQTAQMLTDAGNRCR